MPRLRFADRSIMVMRKGLAWLAWAALLGAPVGAGAEPAAPQEGTPGAPPNSQRRLPDHEIKSPGFPSALAGKCSTAQDCAAYCKKHPSQYGCGKDRKAAP